MHIITRGKTARSHSNIPPCCFLNDAVYQDHIETKVHTGATFERLLRKLAKKAVIREQHDQPGDSLVIIIMDGVAFHSQKALSAIKGHLHECIKPPCAVHYLGGRNSYTFVPLMFKKKRPRNNVGCFSDLPSVFGPVFS